MTWNYEQSSRPRPRLHASTGCALMACRCFHWHGLLHYGREKAEPAGGDMCAKSMRLR